jgi:nucleoside-diphosphate-sugar epimerase
MKKAIITGSTGLVGTAVAKHLSSLGIEVLCLGRQKLNAEDIRRQFGLGSSYLRLAMEDIASLVEHVDSIAWSPGTECVFFNFAWRGDQKLTDGSFDEQCSNAVHAAEAVRSAKKLGCIKFVNTGTLEETFVEQSLEGGSEHPYQSSQSDYALAKLASRDMCKMVAYLEKIDYVHTRLSVPLAPDLSRGTYVAATLKKIVEGKPYEGPTNKQLFDIIFTDDVARAFHLIGFKGKNKADYFIGTSRLMTLGQYFEIFERLVSSNCSDEADITAATSVASFDTEALYRDTGFVATSRFQDMIKNLESP